MLLARSPDRHRGFRRDFHRDDRRGTGRRVVRWLGALLVVALAACSSGGNSGPAASDATSDATPDVTTPDVTAVGAVAASAVETPSLVTALAESGQAEPTMWVAGPGGEGASFVAPGFTAASDGPQDAAWEYFDTFADVYGVATPRDRFEVVAVTPTTFSTVVRFEQSLGGLPVYGGGFTVSVAEPTSSGDAGGNGSAVAAVTGMVLADAELAAAVLDGDAALARAAEVDAGLTPDPATLRAVAFSPLLDGSSGNPVPAWEVEIVGEDEADDQLVVLSALDGEVLAVEPLVAHAEYWDVYESTGTEFNANNATHVLQTRGSETDETPPVAAESATANENMRTVWEYFDEVHGRDGYDDAGGHCTLYIHDARVTGAAYFNTRDGGCRMVFGTAGTDNRSTATLDLVAHELTHGVVSTTAELIYRFQSGALNEHYADFFATMIDNGDWEISVGDIVWRDISVPTDMSQFIVVQGPATSNNDQGGVHSNSAIPNHAGFLVADTIGREAAEQIWYPTLLTLSPHTEFGPWACATISTARQMRDAGRLTHDDVIAVEDAMVAVGLVRDTSIGGIRRPIELCHIAPLDSESDTDAPTTTEPVDSVPTTTTEPDGDGDGGPAECFVGVWELDSQHFLDQILALAGSDLPPGAAIVHVSGRYLVSAFADGTTEDRREEWTWSFSAPDGTIHVILDGVETGTWEIDHGADPTQGALRVHTTGGEINVRLESAFGPLPGGNQTFPSEALGADGTYRCSPTTLEVTTVQEGHTITARFSRVGG